MQSDAPVIKPVSSPNNLNSSSLKVLKNPLRNFEEFIALENVLKDDATNKALVLLYYKICIIAVYNF